MLYTFKVLVIIRFVKICSIRDEKFVFNKKKDQIRSHHLGVFAKDVIRFIIQLKKK